MIAVLGGLADVERDRSAPARRRDEAGRRHVGSTWAAAACRSTAAAARGRNAQGTTEELQRRASHDLEISRMKAHAPEKACARLTAGSPAVSHPCGGRRLLPRVPGPCCRHVAVWGSGGSRADGAGCPARCASAALRQRQRRRADQHGDPDLSQETKVGWHYVAPGKPQQNAFAESFIGRLRDECLNETLFTSLRQARVVLAAWQRDYNEVRPHSAHGGQVPASIRLPSCSPASRPQPGTHRESAMGPVRAGFAGGQS